MSTNTGCHFGVDHYREILQKGIKNGYRFVGFDEIALVPRGQKACVVRHDVDYMPEWDPRFGKIEKDLGIRSTYFFQVCAKTYNLRESRNYQIVHKLAETGHTIGLHFDLTWREDMPWEEVAAYCKKDKEVFRSITGLEPCEIISFHNPHRYVNLILNQPIPGMQHTYEKRFFTDVKYISDSQGWYEGCMCKLFENSKYEKFQFLTHSYIWPDVSTGDFVEDMAHMVKSSGKDLTDYLVTYHPVCKKNEERLRKKVRELTATK